MRQDKANYYLDIAQTVAQRATCLRRKYGAIIVKNDEIIATGYNGAARGAANCSDVGICRRQQLNVPSGERYELCRSVHAEMNAIISTSRRDMIGATLYLAGVDGTTGEIVEEAEPCMLCKRVILNSGIRYIVCRTDKENYNIIDVNTWLLHEEL